MIWNFVTNEKVLSWCDDLKKQEKSKKIHFFGPRRLFSRKTIFFSKSNLVKMWSFGLQLKVFSWCDNLKKQEKSKRIHFLAYRYFLAEKHDSSWCDNLNKNTKYKKNNVFLAYGEFLAENHVFFKIKPFEDLKFWYKRKSFVLMWRFQKTRKIRKNTFFRTTATF